MQYIPNPSLIADIYYETPTNKDLAVGFAIFNYTKSSRILMNYLYTVEKMKLAKIPIFTIELVITGNKPSIKDAYHVYGSSYLFQKENLLRILETKIPEQYTKLLFLDADIIFDNPLWYDMLSKMLDTNDIVHCFETAKWLDITYRKIHKKAFSLIKADNKDIPLWSNGTIYHSGFGWAFTRKWYNEIGFIDEAIIGSGDLIFVYAIFGKKYPGKQNLILYDKIIEDFMRKIVTVKVSFLPVTVYHMFHGDLLNRQYESRNEIFKERNLDKILTKNTDGVFELTDINLNNSMYEYFMNRKDDFV